MPTCEATVETPPRLRALTQEQKRKTKKFYEPRNDDDYDRLVRMFPAYLTRRELWMRLSGLRSRLDKIGEVRFKRCVEDVTWADWRNLCKTLKIQDKQRMTKVDIELLLENTWGAIRAILEYLEKGSKRNYPITAWPVGTFSKPQSTY